MKLLYVLLTVAIIALVYEKWPTIEAGIDSFGINETIEVKYQRKIENAYIQGKHEGMEIAVQFTKFVKTGNPSDESVDSLFALLCEQLVSPEYVMDYKLWILDTNDQSR